MSRKRVKALWPIDTGKVEVWVDDEGLVSTRNKIWYIVTVGGERRWLDPDEVLHFKGLTVDGIVGVNPIDYLRFLVESGAGASSPPTSRRRSAPATWCRHR